MFKKIFLSLFSSIIILSVKAQETSHSVYVNNTKITDTTQQIISGRKNNPSQYEKPYVILISADGFRADFADLYDAKNLKRANRF